VFAERATLALPGFDPVTLDVKDLLAAVQAGTIDAQENLLTNLYNFGIHTQHRYITLTGHFLVQGFYCVTKPVMPLGPTKSVRPSQRRQPKPRQPNGVLPR
jgi:TRAP-type C4-dicarboxylate transport system substrate-binding protein